MISFHRVTFKNYKAFKSFSVNLKDFNLLVGPNNAGKSTVIGAFKILSEGIRKANSRRSELVEDDNGNTVHGYHIEGNDLPISVENAFHDYNDEESAVIVYEFSNKSSLKIVFKPGGRCIMICNSIRKLVRRPVDFKREFPISIGFVPVLGPVEHNEKLYQKEAARKALISYTASRNFRNIWYHYREDFEVFRNMLSSTWPGMDIKLPEAEYGGKDNILRMFCPEERIPRELFWSGYGFQVWCQMLTYIVKNRTASIFIIDEPDIYLHSDLQRQLIGILKEMETDIIIATHSAEMISEAEINDIVLVNKRRKQSKRISNPTQVQEVFNVIGSNLNPILTQIAKTKKVVFVEGKDFQVFSKIARKLGYQRVANRADFAVVPVDGFNPQKLRAFKEGIEKAVGEKINSCVVFDRDYRSESEVNEKKKELEKINEFVHIHQRKEIENFLLIPNSINRAIQNRIAVIENRYNKSIFLNEDIIELLTTIAENFRTEVFGQLSAKTTDFEKRKNPKIDHSTITSNVYRQFESSWNTLESKLKMIPGKEFLSSLNEYLQNTYSFNISKVAVIEAMWKDEIPNEMIEIIEKINDFRK